MDGGELYTKGYLLVASTLMQESSDTEERAGKKRAHQRLTREAKRQRAAANAELENEGQVSGDLARVDFVLLCNRRHINGHMSLSCLTTTRA